MMYLALAKTGLLPAAYAWSPVFLSEGDLKISLISVATRRSRSKRSAEDALTDEYLRRASRFLDITGSWVENTESFWGAVTGTSSRSGTRVILMDQGGRLQSSQEFAEMIRGLRDGGQKQLVVGIGPPDGWDTKSSDAADMLLSIGRWTLPHSLARVVVAEQIYRSLTIIAGHPYHCGH